MVPAQQGNKSKRHFRNFGEQNAVSGRARRHVRAAGLFGVLSLPASPVPGEAIHETPGAETRPPQRLQRSLSFSPRSVATLKNDPTTDARAKGVIRCPATAASHILARTGCDNRARSVAAGKRADPRRRTGAVINRGLSGPGRAGGAGFAGSRPFAKGRASARPPARMSAPGNGRGRRPLGAGSVNERGRAASRAAARVRIGRQGLF